MAKKNALSLPIYVNGDKVENTFKSINQLYYKMRNEVNRNEEGTKEWQKAVEDLAKVEAKRSDMIKTQKKYREEIVKNIEATEGNTDAMESFSDSFSQAFSSARQGDLVGFRAGLMGIKTSIVAATKAGLAFLATPIGMGIAALSAIAIATREWARYNDEAAKANAVTQQLTKLSGEALDDARVRAKSIEKTFGLEFKGNIEAARNLVKAFGITYEEAFDTIEDGLVRGGAQSDDFLASLKEYPKFFADAGFSAEEFQRILTNGEALGMYSDKLPDAIKEFQLSITEQTTATREALENSFGKKFTDELFQNINNGSITSKDALALISEEAEKIGLNAQQSSQLTADLFKGAGEDAGGAKLIFEAFNQSIGEQTRELTELEQQLYNVSEANKRLEQAQNDSLKSDAYAAFANELEVTWINAKADFYGFIDTITSGLITADTAMRRFVFQSVQYVKDAFTVGVDADWESLGNKFDAKQKKLEEVARKRRQQEEERRRKEEESAASKKVTGGNFNSSTPEKEESEDIDKEAQKRAEKEKAIREKVAETLKEWEAERAIQEELEKFDKDKRAEEKEILELEAKFAKLETDAQGEKELLVRLEEEKALQLQDVRDKYSEERLLKDKEEKEKLAKINQEFVDALIEAEYNLQQSKNLALETGIGALKGFFDNASGMYLGLLALEKGFAINEIIINSAKAIAVAKANLAAVPAFIGTIPNPVFPLAVASTSKSILSTKITAGAQIAAIAAETLQGFFYGGPTGNDKASFKDKTGRQPVGFVHENEYVIPEIVRKDPEMPFIEGYIENKRRKKLGLSAPGFNDGGETTPGTSSAALSGSTSRLESLMETLIEISAVKDNEILFGDEAEVKRQERQRKLEKIKNRAKIKKTN